MRRQRTQLEGYKLLIQHLQRSEVRLRRTKSRKSNRRIDEKENTDLQKDVTNFLFPKPDPFEIRPNNLSKNGTNTLNWDGTISNTTNATNATNTANTVNTANTANTANTTINNTAHSMNAATSSRIVQPIRSVFHTIPDDPYTQKDNDEYRLADKTISSSRMQQERRRQEEKKRQQLKQGRPMSARNARLTTQKQRQPDLHSQQQEKKIQLRRPHSAAPSSRRRNQAAEQPAPPSSFQPTAPPVPRSTTRRPATANPRRIARTFGFQNNNIRMMLTNRRKRPKTASIVRRKRVDQRHQERITIHDKDQEFVQQLNKQHLSRSTLQRMRRRVYSSITMERGGGRGGLKDVEKKKNMKKSARSFVYKSQQTLYNGNVSNQHQNQINKKRYEILFDYNRSIIDTHAVYANVLNDVEESMKMGYRLILSNNEKIFLNCLKTLIQHDGGSAFTWNISIYSMFNYMKDQFDPIIFRDPLFVVCIISLIHHSKCFSMNQYKTWCRKNHIALPSSITIKEALEASQQHAQVLASTDKWDEKQKQTNEGSHEKESVEGRIMKMMTGNN